MAFYVKICNNQMNSFIFIPNLKYKFTIMGDFDNREREEVFSKKVRAGKRTYFFDVKAKTTKVIKYGSIL